MISADGEEELSCRCRPLSLDFTKEHIAGCLAHLCLSVGGSSLPMLCCCCCSWHNEEHYYTLLQSLGVVWCLLTQLPGKLASRLASVDGKSSFFSPLQNSVYWFFGQFKNTKENFLLYHISGTWEIDKDFLLSQALLAREQGALQCRHHKETQGWKCFW